jgi:PKD repeat protein
MPKVSSWKNLHGLTGAAALAGALLATGAARPAGAQLACYQQSAYLMDTCGNPSATQADYEFRYANGGYFASADDTSYLVFCKANDLMIYNVGSPMAPTALLKGWVHIPWDWSSIDTGSDTHGPYVNHIKQVATAGGFRYGIVPLGDYGWDFLRISGPGARGFLGTGYHPKRKLSSPEYTNAALFSDGTATFAAAQKLDAGSIASNDSSIQIYRIGTATDLTSGLSSATMKPLARVPTDAAFPTPAGAIGLWSVNFNGRVLLFARRGGLQPAVLIADVTTPSNPQIVNIIQGDAVLFGGQWAIDEGYKMVWVADKSYPKVHAYKIVQTPLGFPGLTYDYSVTWWGTGTEAVSGTTLGVAGNLLVAASLTKVGYLSLAGGQATRLPAAAGFTDLYGRVCSNPNFGESVTKLRAFQVSGQHYVVRSMDVSADIVGVSGSCISTTPLPDFTVTGGSASASCVPPVGYTQADAGFPGDMFTIKDASAGVWDTATLDIQHPLGTSVGTMGGQTFPFTVTSYGQEVTWTPPANAPPGDYHVVLSITGGDPPSVTKVISLCSNPQAALAISQGSAQMLVNEFVNVAATAAGHPDLGYTFYVIPPGGQPASLTGSPTAPTLATLYQLTIPTLSPPPSYTFGVVAKYSFTPTGGSNCSPFLPEGFLGSGYNTCATIDVAAGYVASPSVEVQQPLGTNSNGTVRVDQPVYLKFTGRIASSYTPNFTWSGIGMAGQPTCGYSPGTNNDYYGSTCTIPANSLTAGPAQTWGLSVAVCNGGGLGSPCTTTLQTVSAPSVTVTPTLNSISFSANPTSVNIGTPITITLGQMIPATGYSSLLIDFGGMSCDGVIQDSVSCVNMFGQSVCTQGSQVATFSYAGAGTNNVTITGTLSGGGSVQSASLPITIGSSGTCPCPTVTNTAISGPSSTSVGQTVGFSASANAGGGHGITSWAWTFGDGGTATGQSVTHSWDSTGTYTVRVTATSDCGSTGTDTNTIVIGGGGGGNFTITPSPATVDPGAQVKFTFSPGVSQQGDSVTFNFGDGTAAVSVKYISFCSPASPCSTVTHTYAQAGKYTVTAGGTAGGTSVSGSTTVTVQNNCTQPSAPTAAFTWQPTLVRIGQVVQFHDDSTGTPTAWSWNFGGPGVSGSSSAQTFAVPLATLTITPNNPTPSAGQQVTFTFSPGVSQSGDQVTFNFGDGSATQAVTYMSMFCSPANPCDTISHTFSQAGTYTVSASGTAGGTSVSGTTSVVVSAGGGGGGTLTITPSPASATVGQDVVFTFSPTLSTSGDTVTFNYGDGNQGSVSYPCPLGACAATHAYSAAGTYVVSATGTAGGASVSGTTSVVVGGGGGGTSNLQNPVYTYTAAGTYTVMLTATNCKGSSTTPQQIVVLGTCTQTGPPVADFDWGPTGALTGYPEQEQPYAGQQVTLTDRSTNEPDTWHWYDFQEGAVDQTVTTPTFGYTWTQPGDKNVKMTAANCSGQWSSEVLKAVHIYEDVRHVTADFSWSPSDVSTGAQVTFTAAQGTAYGDPTGFTWAFDDGSTPTDASVIHSFKCGGSRRVTLTATRGGVTGTVTKGVPVSGTSCGPESVMVVDAAKIQGLNDTNWRADVRISNPSSYPTSIWLAFLPVGKDNVTPFTAGPYEIAPKATLVRDNILDWVAATLGQNFSKTALRVTYETDDNIAPIVTVRTYNLLPDGSKYGQINPGVNVVPGTTPSPQWITGLRNNGLTDGFRTNYSIVNLRGDPGGIGGITFTLFDEAGAPLGSKTFGLAPFGYIQDSIKNLFGPSFENIGTFSLKVEVPTGGDVQVYASVMDNKTGDPVLIPATTPPDSPIYLPAMAHISGEASTVWRTDLQVTNPDTNGPHTWEIRYTPKGTGLSVIARSITLDPDKSAFIDDLVSWVYAESATPLPADAQTSGIVRIAPADDTNVYPVVAARSYNLTTIGTFGQGIPALWAARGVAAPDPTRLVLTGMSSEDIARTNLGFVSLSETQGVNFVVNFYDDRGNILNPLGTDGQPKPYTFWIGPGTWDQDKLENRFRNAFKVSLPMSLPAITAEIRVTDGGPGFAYATVIDNKTGDPNSIPAQLTP